MTSSTKPNTCIAPAQKGQRAGLLQATAARANARVLPRSNFARAHTVVLCTTYLKLLQNDFGAFDDVASCMPSAKNWRRRPGFHRIKHHRRASLWAEAVTAVPSACVCDQLVKRVVHVDVERNLPVKLLCFAAKLRPQGFCKGVLTVSKQRVGWGGGTAHWEDCPPASVWRRQHRQHCPCSVRPLKQRTATIQRASA